MKNKYILFSFLLSMSLGLNGQIFHNHTDFTEQDSLRGSITPERVWWDLTYYDLDITVDLDNRAIKGKNTVSYKVLDTATRMQIDLQPPMEVTAVKYLGKSLDYNRNGNVYIITVPPQEIGDQNSLTIHYQGEPVESTNPPWTGGLTWREDKKGNVFMANSNQGDGASLWWPCKDHGYDEPDSMSIRVTVPDPYIDVSNGRLKSVNKNKNGTSTYHWYVDNPINNYGVNLSVAKYAHFNETIQGEKGPLDCNYYVLPENLEKAKKQFKQAPMMIKAFEHWFGPYPFYEDGFKLVEVPYLGMEHQSSVTYGNGYQNGYKGKDRSDSGWGMTFDFIIIHEGGHEWFANNITNKDEADMWIHEAFTSYSEGLYVEYYHGKEAGAEFNISKRHLIQNDKPIIGHYDVNNTGSSDMYDKGANMLHTLRQLVPDDQWRAILRGLNKEFYHQTVTTKQIEDYMSNALKVNLNPFFDQYLRDVRIPILEYRKVGDQLLYRWSNCVDRFNMPVKVNVNGESVMLDPMWYWQNIPHKSDTLDLIIDPNFYVGEMYQGSFE